MERARIGGGSEGGCRLEDVLGQRSRRLEERERERKREIGKGREMPDDDRARVRFRDVYFCFDSR